MRLVDLFAGAGGFSAGFDAITGVAHVFAVEFDRAAAMTYEQNFNCSVFAGDIHLVRRFPKADVVIGGPPCQGFSPLGTRDEGDSRNELWREFLRAVRSAKPEIFVMENVPELLSSRQYADFEALAELSGYRVRARVLNAADYGAPQRRKRVIVIGRRGSAPIFPNQSHRSPEKPGKLPVWRTVRSALRGVPLVPDREPPLGAGPFYTRDLHFSRSPHQISVLRYRAVPEGGNRFDLQRKRPDITPRCWRDKPTGSTDIFGRLWWDRPSVTIRTEFFKPEKGRYLHPVEHRPITHLEAARLQGFDDRFLWCGSKIEIAKQIGNAVPVALAAAIARSVERMLEGATSDEPEQLRVAV